MQAMNIIKRVLELSDRDLHKLQDALVREIKRRKRLSRAALPADNSAVIVAYKFGKSCQPTVTASEAALSVPQRRAA
jgi:hypothetical protein